MLGLAAGDEVEDGKEDGAIFFAVEIHGYLGEIDGEEVVLVPVIRKVARLSTSGAAGGGRGAAGVSVFSVLVVSFAVSLAGSVEGTGEQVSVIVEYGLGKVELAVAGVDESKLAIEGLPGNKLEVKDLCLHSLFKVLFNLIRSVGGQSSASPCWVAGRR